MRILAFVIFCLLGCGLLVAGCRKSASREVVVYTSVDQVYAEPILRDFERKSGIRARAVYDVEATKTTGLATRLVAEKDTPRADVFWNNEFANTLLLQRRGILAPYRSPAAQDLPGQYRDTGDHWAGMGGRARVLLVNTKKVKQADYPSSMNDLLNPKWPAKSVGMANPLFGTAATHAAALYATMGQDKARTFFRRVKARAIRSVDGNSVVRDQVASGQLAWGVTDTDDALGAVERGAPVVIVVPDQRRDGAFVIPGTVAMIAGAPHPREAEELIDFLLSKQTEDQLIAIGGCQFSLRAGAAAPKWLKEPLKPLAVELTDVQEQMPRAMEDLRAIFNR